jgi:hypothetical protein
MVQLPASDPERESPNEYTRHTAVCAICVISACG